MRTRISQVVPGTFMWITNRSISPRIPPVYDISRLATFASSPVVIFLPGVPSARRSYTPNSAYPAVRADRPTA